MVEGSDIMSYYEYYEFLAIDRPFSEDARKEFSKLSRRANVTGRSALPRPRARTGPLQPQRQRHPLTNVRGS